MLHTQSLSFLAYLILIVTLQDMFKTLNFSIIQGIVEVMNQTVQASAGTTQPTMEGIQAASLVTM